MLQNYILYLQSKNEIRGIEDIMIFFKLFNWRTVPVLAFAQSCWYIQGQYFSRQGPSCSLYRVCQCRSTGERCWRPLLQANPAVCSRRSDQSKDAGVHSRNRSQEPAESANSVSQQIWMGLKQYQWCRNLYFCSSAGGKAYTFQVKEIAQ